MTEGNAPSRKDQKQRVQLLLPLRQLLALREGGPQIADKSHMPQLALSRAASLGSTPGACLLCIQHWTQIADPLVPTWAAQTVQKVRMAVQRGYCRWSVAFFLPFLAPPPPDFNLAIDQTNKRRPSILTRQISHHRSTAGFRLSRQPWRISQAVSGLDFNGPGIDRLHTAPGPELEFLQRVHICQPAGRKLAEKCAKQGARVALALRAGSATVRRLQRAAPAAWGRSPCGETTPPLCSATTQARLQLEMCAEKSGRGEGV